MTGGDFMFLNSAEYQVPIRANDQIYLVGFIDSGTVESSVEIRNYRVSVGTGVRFRRPHARARCRSPSTSASPSSSHRPTGSRSSASGWGSSINRLRHANRCASAAR